MQTGYDYIIIGAGSAGAAIAARLSEDKAASVLLLEAGGPDRHALQLMPLGFLRVARSPAYNWGYLSEPEPGLHQRRLPIARGRTLGGSSAINAMIAIRGHRRDYDHWRQLGLAGWGYEDVLPYFRRLEAHWRGADAIHGGDGPVRITKMDDPDLLFEPLAQAAIAAGIPVCDDPNAPEPEGISRCEATIGDGRRASSARAYLYPALDRKNLTIEVNAHAARILLEDGRAVGVEYTQGGKRLVARAASEVILSGGAYNSPQLLLLSGIGPAAHLREIGIDVAHDLPGVGETLCEHPNILNIYRARGRPGLTRHLRYDRALRQAARWFLHHDGPFALNGATANVFLRTERWQDRPDVQFICMPVSNAAELWFPGLTAPPAWCFSARVGALHPRSRGWVRLRSADHRDTPRIRFNMFTEPEDMATMIRGLKACRALYAQTPQRELIESEIFPGADITNEAELAEIIRANATHRSHPVGTCRMGIDAGAVVDAQLRVRGIDGLRIADASVMPELPGGSTNLPSMMIGEKAAEMIRARGPEISHAIAF